MLSLNPEVRPDSYMLSAMYQGIKTGTMGGRVGVCVQFARVYRVFVRNLKYLLWDIYYHAVTLPFAISHKRNKLAVLYVYADAQRYPRSYELLSRLIRRIRAFEAITVRIDNWHEHKTVTKVANNVYDISGDNTYWEFSGWKKGMAFLKERHVEPDLVMFVNDAFMNHAKAGKDYKYYKSRVSTLTLRRLRGSVLGVINGSDTTHILLGYDVSTFIRSNFFVVPYNVAKKLELTFIADDIIDNILPKTYSGKIFNDTDKLNLNLKRFLEVWITQRWTRARAVTSENWGFLKSKLISILNERLLTSKIRELNVEVVNMDTNSVF